jgi:hypothetical protein
LFNKENSLFNAFSFQIPDSLLDALLKEKEPFIEEFENIERDEISNICVDGGNLLHRMKSSFRSDSVSVCHLNTIASHIFI